MVFSTLKEGYEFSVVEYSSITDVCLSAMRSALVFLQRRSQTFSTLSNLALFLKTSSSVLRLVWLIMKMLHSLKILDGPCTGVLVVGIGLYSSFLSAYPIEYIENIKWPCLSTSHPSNIVLLTCDARGVLPPISKLTSEQTMFHFISGYTSKMAGTEDGVTEPQATFSSCFAQPFLALHPMRYAKMLADKIEHHKANAWLLNTGWVGAGATTGGKRCP